MMTGLDTNILVRYFTNDDLEQGRRAADLLRNLTLESMGYVSLVTLIELVWVPGSTNRGRDRFNAVDRAYAAGSRPGGARADEPRSRSRAQDDAGSGGTVMGI